MYELFRCLVATLYTCVCVCDDSPSPAFGRAWRARAFVYLRVCWLRVSRSARFFVAPFSRRRRLSPFVYNSTLNIKQNDKRRRCVTTNVGTNRPSLPYVMQRLVVLMHFMSVYVRCGGVAEKPI